MSEASRRGLWAKTRWCGRARLTQDLVVDYRCVLIDKDVLDGEDGNFSKEDAAKCVGERGIYPDKGEDRVQRVVLVELDRHGLG